MQKLKRKQIPENNGHVHLMSLSQSSEKHDDKPANLVAGKFQLHRPEAKSDTDNVGDILDPLGGEYTLDDSDATFSGFKTTLNDELMLHEVSKTVPKREISDTSADADIIDRNNSNEGSSFVEIVGLDPVVKKHSISAASLDISSSEHSHNRRGLVGLNKYAQNNELGGESVVKSEVKLQDLWSHISRTSSTLCLAAFVDTPLNPWTNAVTVDAESNNPEVATSDSASRVMLSMNRELRAEQDADYSASLAAGKENDASALRILKEEVLLAVMRIY